VNPQQALLAHYAVTHPDDVARQVDQLPGEDLGPLLMAMGAETAAELLPRLAQTQAARALVELEPEHAAAVLGDIPLDIAASLVRRLDQAAAGRLVDALPVDRATPVRALLCYPAQSAGGIMDPHVLTAPLSASVADARTLISDQSTHLDYYVYVFDTGHRLVGVVDVAELLQADPKQPLQAVMHTSVQWLAAEASLDAVFVHPGWHLYDALPVLGDDRRFLGVIRHRRMRQLLETHRQGTPGEPAVQTVMALGEIYWLGLCGLLQGFATTAADASAPRKDAP
jgi:magnesium transporter